MGPKIPAGVAVEPEDLNRPSASAMPKKAGKALSKQQKKASLLQLSWMATLQKVMQRKCVLQQVGLLGSMQSKKGELGRL